MNKLTPIQGKVLDFIVREIRRRSLPPTHREISAAFAWRSNAAAKCHLLALEKKGFIRTRLRISRGIELKPAALDRAGGDDGVEAPAAPGMVRGDENGPGRPS